MKCLIGRPIEGISINGLEYACDSNDLAIVFESEEDAREFLYQNGYTDEDIENDGIVFVKEEDYDGNYEKL